MDHSDRRLGLQGQEPKDDTRERLLDAAERLFCQNGFEATCVRELTALAGCNVAAVNYHFGGKQGLYQQMFRRQMQRMLDSHIQTIEGVLAGPAPSLEELLRGIVSVPVRAAQGGEPRAAVMQLMVREVLNRHVDPEPILKDVKEKFVESLGHAVRRFVPSLTERQAEMIAFSVDALVLHPVLFMPYYMAWIDGLDLDGLVDHTVRFMASGIRGLAQGSPEG